MKKVFYFDKYGYFLCCTCDTKIVKTYSNLLFLIKTDNINLLPVPEILKVNYPVHTSYLKNNERYEILYGNNTIKGDRNIYVYMEYDTKTPLYFLCKMYIDSYKRIYESFPDSIIIPTQYHWNSISEKMDHVVFLDWSIK